MNVPIVYGLPTREFEAAARRGDLVLCGCLFSFDAPDMVCWDCGREWQSGALPEASRIDSVPANPYSSPALKRGTVNR